MGISKIERIKLKRLIYITNIVKFTIGLPLLIIVAFRFLYNICRETAKLFIDITLQPENIKQDIERITELREGLAVLWATNKLNEERNEIKDS